jgi:energy-coupling factor transporter ATP-binding protein EcfA2
MIERLTLKNFKGHRDSSIVLRPLTVLVGPNGAGKTSTLEALHYLGQLYYKDYAELFAGPRAPAALMSHRPGVEAFSLGAWGRSSAGERSLELAVVQKNYEQVDNQGDESEVHEVEATFKLGYGEGRQPEGATLELRYGEGRQPEIVGDSPLPRSEGRLRYNRSVYDDEGRAPEAKQNGHRSLREEGPRDHWPELRSAVFLRLDARRVAAPSIALERPRVEFDGSGTASVLANLKLTDEERLERIVRDLRRVVPQVKGVRVLPTTLLTSGERGAGFRLAFDFENDGGLNVPATGASEGTLLTLALLTVLHGPSRPRLLLLDDVHQALHPRAQSSLMKILLDLSAGPVQIIVTTHSPYILDTVEPDCVRVFALRPDGTTAIEPLSKHPEAAAYRGALSTGQLWTLDDEQSWVTPAAP